MQITLLDDHRHPLTEVASHPGKSPGRMLVDWATRPDAMFEYYFDRGGRIVTVERGAASWRAILGTRWQMGARFWFLDIFSAASTNPDAPRADPPQGTTRRYTRFAQRRGKQAGPAR
jgi:hypothetical protein